MELKEAFEEWFEDRFMNTQEEDAPYNYEDIVSAFVCGYNYGSNKNESIITESCLR